MLLTTDNKSVILMLVNPRNAPRRKRYAPTGTMAKARRWPTGDTSELELLTA